jgi:hypothetical protein
MRTRKPRKIFYLIPFIVLLSFYSCAPTIYVQQIHEKYLVSVASSKSIVIFPSMGMTVLKKNGNGIQGYLEASDDKGAYLSVYIEPAINCTSSIDCRNYSLSKIKKLSECSNFKEWEDKDNAFSENFVKEYQGVTVNQKHFNMHVVKDDYWYDFHLSIMDYDSIYDKKVKYFYDNIEFK